MRTSKPRSSAARACRCRLDLPKEKISGRAGDMHRRFVPVPCRSGTSRQPGASGKACSAACSSCRESRGMSVGTTAIAFAPACTAKFAADLRAGLSPRARAPSCTKWAPWLRASSRIRGDELTRTVLCAPTHSKQTSRVCCARTRLSERLLDGSSRCARRDLPRAGCFTGINAKISLMRPACPAGAPDRRRARRGAPGPRWNSSRRPSAPPACRAPRWRERGPHLRDR